MKKTVFFIITVCLLAAFYYIYTHIFDKKSKFELSENDSKVLLDSLKVDDSSNLYWFKYESYVGNSTVSFIGFGKSACDCNMNNSFVKGEFIKGIKKINGDSIFIASRYGFDILKSTKIYHFIDIRTDQRTDSLRHINREIYFHDLCK